MVHGAQGNNPRFVVTNLEGEATQLYEKLYCARGEAENRIKEAQLDLFGTRASCHRFAANQLRLLLAALAYTLMQRLRELALQGSELERATAATIRVRLLKIGAAVMARSITLRPFSSPVLRIDSLLPPTKSGKRWYAATPPTRAP